MASRAGGPQVSFDIPAGMQLSRGGIRSHNLAYLGSLPRPPQEIFDDIIAELKNRPLNEACEDILGRYLNSAFVIFWMVLPNLNSIYSPTHGKILPIDAGLVGFVVKTNSIVTASLLSSHSSFNHEYDTQLINPEAQVLLFPIVAKNVQAVVFVRFRKPVFAMRRTADEKRIGIL